MQRILLTWLGLVQMVGCHAAPTVAVVGASAQRLQRSPARYVAGMEMHDNPDRDPNRPQGEHKGITIYVLDE